MKTAQFICTFLLSWQAIFRLTDSSINVLFKFLNLLLLKLSLLTGSENLQFLHKVFPSSLKQAQTLKGIDTNKFAKFVTCGKCHTTYFYDDCIRSSISACKFIAFPRHPQKRMRKECGFSLMKSVRTPSGKLLSVPLKVFCYRSIIYTIKELVQKPGMIDLFNCWRLRHIPEGIMADIYDGVVWKSFCDAKGDYFFSGCFSLGLLINVDWLQPYKHVQYSVGAIYNFYYSNFELSASFKVSKREYDTCRCNSWST